jgi:hypothetical protein
VSVILVTCFPMALRSRVCLFAHAGSDGCSSSSRTTTTMRTTELTVEFTHAYFGGRGRTITLRFVNRTSSRSAGGTSMFASCCCRSGAAFLPCFPFLIYSFCLSLLLPSPILPHHRSSFPTGYRSRVPGTAGMASGSIKTYTMALLHLVRPTITRFSVHLQGTRRKEATLNVMDSRYGLLRDSNRLKARSAD